MHIKAIQIKLFETCGRSIGDADLDLVGSFICRILPGLLGFTTSTYREPPSLPYLKVPTLLILPVPLPKELLTCIPKLHILGMRVVLKDRRELGRVPQGLRALLLGETTVSSFPTPLRGKFLHYTILFFIFEKGLVRYRVNLPSCNHLRLLVSDFPEEEVKTKRSTYFPKKRVSEYFAISLPYSFSFISLSMTIFSRMGQ